MKRGLYIRTDEMRKKMSLSHLGQTPWNKGKRHSVELRYEINNGITLCHAHHPRKRAEEKRLSPYFQELVSVSKESF